MTSRRKSGGASKRASTARAAPSRARAPVRHASQKRANALSAAPGADCTIAHAAALHARLARVVAKPAPLSLDLSAIKRVDTAGLQVLAAFVRQRRADGREVACVGAGEVFLSAARLLGLDTLFAVPANGGGAAA
jgi:phospholipid transport system transporter-binding protein